MTALELQNYLKAHYPKENEACEWKEFKKSVADLLDLTPPKESTGLPEGN